MIAPVAYPAGRAASLSEAPSDPLRQIFTKFNPPETDDP